VRLEDADHVYLLELTRSSEGLLLLAAPPWFLYPGAGLTTILDLEGLEN